MIDRSVKRVSPISVNMDALVRIESDVFDIGARLKEIDGGYYPVYNLTKNRYEIHHSGKKNTLQVVLPYDGLDARAIQKVRETRIEYADVKLREIDRENEKRRIEQENKSKENAIVKIEKSLSKQRRRGVYCEN